MTQESAAVIAASLPPYDRDFLRAVCDGTPLGCADRIEDRVRQRCRRAGLVEVLKNARRWSATPLGKEVRALLTARTGDRA